MGDPDVIEARRWLGTPFARGQSLRGVGCDCLGLLRGVWRARIGAEPETVRLPPESEVGDAAALLAGLTRHLRRIEGEAELGDWLLLRLAPNRPARHLALLGERASLIHAHERFGVIESPFTESWRRRVAVVFRFPQEAH